MKTALVTGSAGLIGSESARFLMAKKFKVVGIDNDLRRYFFGAEASTAQSKKSLESEYGDNYIHINEDIRNEKVVNDIFRRYKPDVIIHTAAQPSHDWAASEPITDFSINAVGTLVLLEATRLHCRDATFIFTSTNKVYGDRPNQLPLVEKELRWEIAQSHQFAIGIDESMSIDNAMHSVFGASKVAADIMVQEYGKYFGLNTGIFRCGCLTGPMHMGAESHGFLAYLVKCVKFQIKYTIFGHKGKQVRDNIHAYDLVNMFWHFHQNPKSGEVYNVGGGRHSNISMLEAIKEIEKITNKEAIYEYRNESRKGDHVWYISDVSKFKNHYPEWDYQYDISAILKAMC